MSEATSNDRLKVHGGRSAGLFGLRMPDEFKDVLRAKADQNGRSMNSEILVRLRKSLEEEGKNE